MTMLTAMAWVFALMAIGQDAPPGTVVTAEEHGATLKQSVANNTVDTLVKSVNMPGGKASVAVLYRTKPETNALIHERVTEVYQILEGSGTLVTGGHLEGATPTDLTRLGAGPSRSGKRVGGESRRVNPKDIIIIPAGTPHSFGQLDGPISYLVYRFDPTSPSK
jgi:mannose-6-phosphate isomerase-like protein (cupin superfamily)